MPCLYRDQLNAKFDAIARTAGCRPADGVGRRPDGRTRAQFFKSRTILLLLAESSWTAAVTSLISAVAARARRPRRWHAEQLENYLLDSETRSIGSLMHRVGCCEVDHRFQRSDPMHQAAIDAESPNSSKYVFNGSAVPTLDVWRGSDSRLLSSSLLLVMSFRQQHNIVLGLKELSARSAVRAAAQLRQPVLQPGDARLASNFALSCHDIACNAFAISAARSALLR